MSTSTIDDYLAAAASPWPAEPLSSLVETIRGCASFDEAIKWGQPYFSLSGRAVVKLFAAKGWIDVFYYRGAELADPDGLLSGEGASAMRRLQILRDAEIPLQGIGALTREAVLLSMRGVPTPPASAQ